MSTDAELPSSQNNPSGKEAYFGAYSDPLQGIIWCLPRRPQPPNSIVEHAKNQILRGRRIQSLGNDQKWLLWVGGTWIGTWMGLECAHAGIWRVEFWAEGMTGTSSELPPGSSWKPAHLSSEKGRQVTGHMGTQRPWGRVCTLLWVLEGPVEGVGQEVDVIWFKLYIGRKEVRTGGREKGREEKGREENRRASEALAVLWKACGTGRSVKAGQSSS